MHRIPNERNKQYIHTLKKSSKRYYTPNIQHFQWSQSYSNWLLSGPHGRVAKHQSRAHKVHPTVAAKAPRLLWRWRTGKKVIRNLMIRIIARTGSFEPRLNSSQPVELRAWCTAGSSFLSSPVLRDLGMVIRNCNITHRPVESPLCLVRLQYLSLRCSAGVLLPMSSRSLACPIQCNDLMAICFRVVEVKVVCRACCCGCCRCWWSDDWNTNTAKVLIECELMGRGIGGFVNWRISCSKTLRDQKLFGVNASVVYLIDSEKDLS